MQKIFAVGWIVLSSFHSLIAQDVVTLTLDDCVTTALERNTQIKRAKNDELIASANSFQAVMNLFPSVTAGINYDYFFGTFFDTNAARQISKTTNSSNPNVSSSVVLFNGLSNYNNMKSSRFAMDAARYDLENTIQSVESNILINYLNVILDQENLKISLDRVNLLEAQLEREKKRESVGVGNLESVYNFQSQVASERLNQNLMENTLERDRLLLIQSMQIDPSEAQYEVESFALDEDDLLFEVEPFDKILEECIGANPSLKGARADLNSSQYQYKAAVGQRLPTISAYGRVGSNYSSNGALNPETGSFEPKANFSKQMNFNEFEYLNFSLSIPIFNGYRLSNQMQVARLNMANSELDVTEAINSITNLVQQAYLDLVNAQSTYTSALENLEALQQSFDFMKKRYETGNTDFYTYLESLNSKNNAEVQLLNAKYSIIFRKKILDIYRNN